MWRTCRDRPHHPHYCILNSLSVPTLCDPAKGSACRTFKIEVTPAVREPRRATVRVFVLRLVGDFRIGRPRRLLSTLRLQQGQLLHGRTDSYRVAGAGIGEAVGQTKSVGFG